MESPGSDLPLLTFLDATMEVFVWRPSNTQWISGYVGVGDTSLDHIDGVVGIPLDDTSAFMEIAFYWGIVYAVFGDDPSMSIISTDHEVAWNTNEVRNHGTPTEFLKDFLSVAQIIDTVVGALGE